MLSKFSLYKIYKVSIPRYIIYIYRKSLRKHHSNQMPFKWKKNRAKEMNIVLNRIEKWPLKHFRSFNFSIIILYAINVIHIYVYIYNTYEMAWTNVLVTWYIMRR